MIQINEFEFVNDDIGYLAIHLSRAWAPKAAVPIPANIVNGNVQAYNGYGVLLGYSVFNADAVVVNTVTVRDSVDNGGQPLAFEVVPISGAITRSFSPSGLEIKRGLNVTGTAAGVAVLYVVRHRHHD